MWQTQVTVSVSDVVGLLMQLTALWLVHVTIKGRWLNHTGAMLLAMACVYHGFTEVLQFLFPGRNQYRAQLLDQGMLDRWMLLVSGALLTYAVVYAAAMRGRPATPEPDRLRVAFLQGLQVKWMLLLCGPLIVLSLRGQGAVAPGAIGTTADQSNYATAGLAGQFLVFLTALTAIVVVARFGGGWLLPVLAVQAGILGLIGMRSAILVSAVLVLYGIRRLGVTYSKKMLATALVFIAVAAMSISASRAVSGRAAFMANQGAGGRVAALTSGLTAIPSQGDAILNDFVYRFDANVFGPQVVHGLDDGAPPVGLTTLGNDVQLAVPSFLNPNKLTSDVTQRDERAYFDAQFGINPNLDMLPGLWGFMPGYFGLVGMFVLSASLAVAMAALDRWLGSHITQSAFLVSMGVTLSVLMYENLPTGFLTQGRGVLLFVVGMTLLRFLRAGVRRGSVPPGQELVREAGVRGVLAVGGPAARDRDRLQLDGAGRRSHGDRPVPGDGGPLQRPGH